MVFGYHKLLPGDATAHPIQRHKLGQQYMDAHVVTTDKCITSQGPGTAIEFALTLLETLCDKDTADKVAHQVLFHRVP